MASKLLALACIRKESYGDLSPRPHYPSMPKYPKGVSAQATSLQGSEAKTIFSVIGMTGSVEKALKRLPGIKEAVVDVLNNKAQVLFYPSFVNEESIREAIEDVGFQAALVEDETNEKSIQVCRIRINGMTCTSCSSTVENVLQAIPGVQKVQVAFATEEAEVHYDPKSVTYNQLMEAIEDTGFGAILVSTGKDMSKINLRVDGVRTDNSMRMLENSIQALPGDQAVEVSPELKKISVSYKPDMTGPRNFIRVIGSTGTCNGTLTVGKPVVVNTRLLRNMVLHEFYELVAATEVNSEHPLAKAIIEYAKKFREDEENPAWLEARDFISITVHGVKAIVRNRKVIVGNKSLILDRNSAIPADAEDMLTETEGIAQTGILVWIDRKVAGVLAISDPVKSGAHEVIFILKSMNV
ncbi:hypothetical protein GQ457_11G023700 [Hibiscus cannabinus]